ncbi:MAG: DUF2089 family protein [Clostridiales bacterium]|nr:DUF2089 family protein [Clostridiales bacterium]
MDRSANMDIRKIFASNVRKYRLKKELSQEQLHFVEVFLSCRGNIKDVEKKLNISYPTVRGKLDEINQTLGLNARKNSDNEKQHIMNMLENGEISSDEAIKLLKNL